MKKSQKTWIWLSLAISSVVIFAVCAATFNVETLFAILRINIFFLLAALALRVLSLGFWALRLKVMTGSLGYRVEIPYLFNLVLVNLFAGAITPGQAGGDPVRVHGLYKASVKVGDATAVVIMERVLDGVVLVAMGTLAILILGPIWEQLGTGLALAMFLGFLFIVVVILLIYYSMKRPEPAKRLIKRILTWIERHFPGKTIRKMVDRADEEMETFVCGVRSFTGSGRGLLLGLLWTAGFWISEFLVASVLLIALGQPPFIAESYLFQLVIAVIMMIPLTPGSSGMAEISAASLYALIVPSSLLGVFILLWRGLFFYFNIVVGFVAGLNAYRNELITED
ncbi:MAG: flippase-like domain-containing protein [Methanolinea sp.]|jgi:hypothetical protein|nr:flippase-like domain-containing protein [Methanolinea sp.]